MKKLHLGCWNNPLKQYINLDLLKLDWVDVVHNMEEFPYPFEDDTFDEIFSSHVFEHIQNLEWLMKEIYRISKKWAIIKIRVPHYANWWSFTDPTHKRFFAWIFPCSELDYYWKWTNNKVYNIIYLYQ